MEDVSARMEEWSVIAVGVGVEVEGGVSTSMALLDEADGTETEGGGIGAGEAECDEGPVGGAFPLDARGPVRRRLCPWVLCTVSLELGPLSARN